MGELHFQAPLDEKDFLEPGWLRVEPQTLFPHFHCSLTIYYAGAQILGFTAGYTAKCLPKLTMTQCIGWTAG